MKKAYISRLLASTCLVLALAGCIKNDIPYPRIQANIVTISAEGEDRGAAIDSTARTVSLYFPEEVDIQNVSITECTTSPGSTLVGEPFENPVDLSSPMKVSVRLYQDWTWTITGVQDIERYFTVSGQVGQSEIDVPGRRVVAYVSKSTSLRSIKVESIKLGPIGSELWPMLEEQTVDFSKPVEVEVRAYGRTTLWTIYIERSTVDVSTESVDAWTNVAWVYGSGEQGKDNGIEYRLQGDSEWIRVSDSDMTFNGGSFYARISHLSPLTTYEARAFSDDATGDILTFTTGSVVQVPNHDLDEWWLDGKVWNPWPENGEQYWDTGNKGATTLGTSNSMPTDDTSSGSGWAAMLETRFVGIGVLGKLAAGNLFVGKYVRTEGTNGVLSMGQPFTERPTKMKGYLKYNCETINYSSTEMDHLKGQPDTCIVWCALIDSPSPLEIRTNPKDRQLFEPDADYVVAYGRVQYGETVGSYIPFEFELEYKSTSRVPTYVLITASASKYGDYFTGGAGSTLYVDNLEFIYDY